MRATCGEVQCGSVAGEHCGRCDDPEYCSDAGQCIHPCDEAECGVHLDTDCGECEGMRCEGNVCMPGCVGMECGTDEHGFECGVCAANAYCDGAGQCQPGCEGIECGDGLRGADCGTCEGLNYCSATGRCQPACIDLACGDDRGVDCGSCAAGMLCEAGQCVAGSCEPDATYCEEGRLLECNADGRERTALRTCPADTFCDVSAMDCTPHRCVPGAQFCDGVHWSVCDVDGSGAAPDGRDCAASGVDCTPLGCGTAEVYERAPSFDRTVSVMGQFAVGAYISVTQNARLLSIAHGIRPVSGEFAIRYFVHASESLDGTYEPVLLRSVVDRTASSSIEDLTLELDMELEAGKHYLIGAGVFDGQAYRVSYDDSGSHPQELQFGTTTSGFRSAGFPAASLDGRVSMEDRVYGVRLQSIVLAP